MRLLRINRSMQTVVKPWGKFLQFTHNEPTTVKILHLERDSALSLQYHEKRKELWYVTDGVGQAFVEGQGVITLVQGDIVEVPVGMKHRLKTFAMHLDVLEISFGEFDENDIIRVEDKYGRT